MTSSQIAAYLVSMEDPLCQRILITTQYWVNVQNLYALYLDKHTTDASYPVSLYRNKIVTYVRYFTAMRGNPWLNASFLMGLIFQLVELFKFQVVFTGSELCP